MPLDLLRRRLIFVTGKGGVGKTTVALALGLAAARGGLRTIVADLEGDGSVAPTEQPFAERLFRVSIDPQSAMEEYLLVKLPGATGQLLRQSRLFGAFAMATPGMRELLCIGKLWELAQLERRTADAVPYDLVIVDGPASGHGAAMLRAPGTFAEIARVGPIAAQAQAIAQTLADRDFTAVVAVSTAEEMAVSEALMLRDMLREGPGCFEPRNVILNGAHPDRFSAADLELIVASRGADSPVTRLAREEALLAATEREQRRRLLDAFGERLLTLPYLLRPRLEQVDLELLATELLASGVAAALDASGSDGPASDGPGSDGPTSDGPGSEPPL